MANHLRQVSFLFILWAGLAPSQVPSGPFSHALHLKLKADCTSCHTTVAASERVEDNLLPSPSACKPCHESVVISEPMPVAIAKFSHKQHAPFGSIGPVLQAAVKSKAYLGTPNHTEELDTKNACVSCHRAVVTSAAPSHELIPQMSDCLTCHNKIELPYSCETCHSTKQNLKPVNHIDGFVDQHTTAKVDKAGCNTCHGNSFTCMGCHKG